MDLSIVVPLCNERENVQLLYRQLMDVLPAMNCEFEILLVDDGSTDGTTDELEALAAQDRRVKVICFRRNYGQTAAMQAGIQMAQGEAIVTLDGDLQNDPADIPLMVAKLHEGYDLVHGWRKHRQDRWLDRKLPSLLANKLISRVTRFPIHDLGCTLKVIRREIAQELELYGEMHRFIPILAYQRGARCAEVVTRHHARRFGRTKYGLSRTVRVLLDLVTVKYLITWFGSPMKLFGLVGVLCTFVSLLSALGTLTMKFSSDVDMTGNPLLLLTAFAGLASLQFFSLGLLGEVCARIYYSGQRENFAIRRLINFGEPPRVHRRAA